MPDNRTGTTRPAPPVICLLLAACLLVGGGAPAPEAGAAAANDDSGSGDRLLETGSAAKVSAAAAAPAELKIVCYNMRWRGGEDLQKLIRLLREDAEIGGAAIVGLQEVDRHKKRTDHTNTARVLAEALGMHYAWAAPPQGKDSEEEETGVAVLSRYRLTDVERIVLPHEGPNGRRRAALGATAHVGEVRLRVYSVHAETRMPLEKKIEHWAAVLEDLKRHPGVAHAVVLGDFNTIKGKDVRAARRLFTDAGFATPFDDDTSTWKTFVIKLKLDWLWLRGMDVAGYGIDRGVGLSDHWPLWVRVNFGKKGAPVPFKALAPSSPPVR